MGIGQPVVQRHESDLRAVTDEQEYEGERQNGGFELPLHAVELGPQQRATAGAQELLGRKVEQDGAEERLRDADAAENEIFPGGFEARWRAIERYQQHGGERRRFQRDPQDAHVVGDERQQHREIEHLVHAVVEPQPRRRQAAMVLLDLHVRAREDRRREAHERRKRDQKHIEGIDKEKPAGDEHRPVVDHPDGQRDRREPGEEAHRYVDPRRPGALADRGEEQRAGEREDQHGDGLDHPFYSASLSFSRCFKSRLSNCSRIWKKNTPRISMPTSTSSAIPSSTTIGMP